IKHLPRTHLTFLIATLAISGIFPLSGFFSKDEILWAAFNRSWILWLVGAFTAALTAFYMGRLYTLVFLGKGRYDKDTGHHLHESPATMTVPLVVLAVLSFIGGFVGIPEVFRFPNLLEGYLAPVLHAGGAVIEAATHGAGLEIAMMAVSFVIAAVALFFGCIFYARYPEIPERFAENTRLLYRLVVHKYFVDELYGRIILTPYYALCRSAAWFDKWFLDGMVNATGYLTLGASYISIGFDTYVVDGLVNLAGYSVRGASWLFRRLQTGIVQSYATAMILG